MKACMISLFGASGLLVALFYNTVMSPGGDANKPILRESVILFGLVFSPGKAYSVMFPAIVGIPFLLIGLLGSGL